MNMNIIMMLIGKESLRQEFRKVLRIWTRALNVRWHWLPTEDFDGSAATATSDSDDDHYAQFVSEM